MSLTEKVWGNVTVKDIGVAIGNFLVFISIFLPWYTANIYGEEKVYTGIYLASNFYTFWLLYLLPMIGGMGLIGGIMYAVNKKIFEKSPKMIALIFAVLILVITFIAMFLVPPTLYTPIIDSMSIGGYTALTGGIISLILTIFR